MKIQVIPRVIQCAIDSQYLSVLDKIEDEFQLKYYVYADVFYKERE